MAYLIGSQIARYSVLDEPFTKDGKPLEVLGLRGEAVFD